MTYSLKVSSVIILYKIGVFNEPQCYGTKGVRKLLGELLAAPKLGVPI